MTSLKPSALSISWRPSVVIWVFCITVPHVDFFYSYVSITCTDVPHHILKPLTFMIYIRVDNIVGKSKFYSCGCWLDDGQRPALQMWRKKRKQRIFPFYLATEMQKLLSWNCVFKTTKFKNTSPENFSNHDDDDTVNGIFI